MPRLLGWAITLITILLSAVAPAAAQPARLEPLAPPRKVKAGIVNQISDAGIYIAVQRGYFKELGLDVELVVFQSAATMIGPLGTGELDVGGGATAAGLWNAEQRNIGIRAVADKGSSRKGWGFVALVTRSSLILRPSTYHHALSLQEVAMNSGVPWMSARLTGAVGSLPSTDRVGKALTIPSDRSSFRVASMVDLSCKYSRAKTGFRSRCSRRR